MTGEAAGSVALTEVFYMIDVGNCNQVCRCTIIHGHSDAQVGRCGIGFTGNDFERRTGQCWGGVVFHYNDLIASGGCSALIGGLPRPGDGTGAHTTCHLRIVGVGDGHLGRRWAGSGCSGGPCVGRDWRHAAGDSDSGRAVDGYGAIHEGEWGNGKPNCSQPPAEIPLVGA